MKVGQGEMGSFTNLTPPQSCVTNYLWLQTSYKPWSLPSDDITLNLIPSCLNLWASNQISNDMGSSFMRYKVAVSSLTRVSSFYKFRTSV